MQRRGLINGRVATALFMVLLFGVMSLLALGFPEKARLMPLLVGLPGVVLGLVQLVVEVRTSAREAATGKIAGISRAERDMFLWILLFFFGILAFGFTYASPVLVFAFLLIGRNESLPVALFSAIGTWAALYGIFEKSFEIPLFTGLVVEWLAG